MVEQLRSAGIRVSLFIEPSERQVDAALRLGAPVVEFHTGRYAHVEGNDRAIELKRIADCAAPAEIPIRSPGAGAPLPSTPAGRGDRGPRKHLPLPAAASRG